MIVRRTVAWTIAVVLATGVVAVRGEENPAMEGFDLAGSDVKAIEIADQVMSSMGGRGAWDQTRLIAWNFFGLRTHVWDKWNGNLRFKQGNNLVLMNVVTQKGRAWQGGEEVTEEAALAQSLKGAYQAWINDSYWLLMPYKLKDSGVTLKYKGEADTENGRPSHVLELTFEGVGVTPQNKYHVFVDQESQMVEQWSFFPTRDTEEARFTNPWANWERHGKVLLSGDRGRRKITDIAVFDSLPPAVFESPEPVDLTAFPRAE